MAATDIDDWQFDKFDDGSLSKYRDYLVIVVECMHVVYWCIYLSGWERMPVFVSTVNTGKLW